MQEKATYFVAGLALCGLAMLLVTPRISAQQAEKEAAVEYKVLPASEFGMNVVGGEGIFSYRKMTERLNELSADGWKYRDFVKAADGSGALSAVLLERTR